MKAHEVMTHFKNIGQWVNWDKTCDQFLHGDPDSEVKGIATAWIPTNIALRQAAGKGYNLFITHEPAFYPGYEETASGAELIRGKRALLDQLGITLLRCHDTWDRMPEFGIPDAWASFLGFKTEPRPLQSFYKICLLDGCTAEQAAKMILDKVRVLGQKTALIFGDKNKKLRRMAVGTGAITHLPAMYELKSDAMLVTDDGFNFWTGGLWAADLDVPLIIVNHATAEKPGMMAMAKYLRNIFRDVPVEYIDVNFPYGAVVTAE